MDTVPLPLAQSPLFDRLAHPSATQSRPIHAPRLLALWHLASLDAPTVAVVWSLGFAWADAVHVAGSALLVLALAAWSAYVCDRLLDARLEILSPAESDLRERHFFHRRHRRLLAPLALTAAGVAAVLAVSLLPTMVREAGLILGAAALIYFLGVHAPRFVKGQRSLPKRLNKEMLVAVLFTAGCILAAWSRPNVSGALKSCGWCFWISAVYFAALAWLNCSSIARWESRAQTGNDSLKFERLLSVGRASHGAKSYAAFLIAMVGLLLAFVTGSFRARAAAMLAAGAASALLLALLDRMQARMTPLALRIAADLVLLTPLLLLIG
ncbi:MAG TPA: hypothetical protein VMT38_01380 [Terracidiphilus sp.]|nr:hypothetical protein [Terracidiphilus sp.]